MPLVLGVYRRTRALVALNVTLSRTSGRTTSAGVTCPALTFSTLVRVARTAGLWSLLVTLAIYNPRPERERKSEREREHRHVPNECRWRLVIPNRSLGARV